MVGYSFYLLLSQTERRVWLFVMTLTCVTVAIFLPGDLIWGGRRSISTRYMIPCYLGMQIAVAYFLAVKMTSPQVTMQLQKLWRLAMAALLSIGILSCCIYLPADSGWNKDRSYINIPIARTINSASGPLLVTDLWVYSIDKSGNLLGMSHQIDSQAKLLLMSPKNVEIPGKFTDIFLYSISQELKTQIAQTNQYKIQAIYTEGGAIILGKTVKKGYDV
jgi:uncharacterized membrane protein